MECILEDSGVSVAPLSCHSQHLVPQVLDQGPNLESRQRCASKVSEPEDNDEGITIIISYILVLITLLVDNATPL